MTDHPDIDPVFALTIHPDGTYTIDLELPSLPRLQELVGGGFVEEVPRAFNGFECSMFVNEEPRDDMKLNAFAFQTTRQQYRGPLVMAGLPDEEGELTALAPVYAKYGMAMCDLFTEMKRIAVLRGEVG